MPQRAHVTSVEAIENFRSQLVVYLSQARPALEEVSAEVVRTRVWLENDQRLRWENEIRRRTKEWDEARQALFSARIGNLKTGASLEQLAVHRTKRVLDEADDKLRVLKRWNREFESRVQPLVKQVEKLHTVLAMDMVHAVAYLSQALDTLAAYAMIRPPSADVGVTPGSASPETSIPDTGEPK